MTELIWDGKYKDGKKQGPVRIALPFQTIETVNESAQDRQRALELFSSGRDTEWRNRLIWGDKKYVLPSLLPEFAGKVNLIYIDPPFDTGADFSFTATIPQHPDADENDAATFTKEPSILEQKAYRDTWGRGLDSYLQWFYEAAVLLHELLAEDGSIYVHLDWHVGHYAKVAMDEVFGNEMFRNHITWKRSTPRGNAHKRYPELTDYIFLYTRSENSTWNDQYAPYRAEYLEQYYSYVEEETGKRFQPTSLLGHAGINPVYEWRGLKKPWRYPKHRLEELDKAGILYWPQKGEIPRLKRYLSEQKGVPLQSLWEDIPPVNSQALEDTRFATQKPEALLERIIKASSREGDLVLDCFVGSGTTAAVAEKLNRRWIACDLGRFAIHTTRKRLLGIPGVKPFVVQNLGKYERQAWQMAEFPVADTMAATSVILSEAKNLGRSGDSSLPEPALSGQKQILRFAQDDSEGAPQNDRLEERRQREAAYRKFILELYHATFITGRTWLHGMKSGRMVHVGAVDAPVTLADVKAIAREAWKAVASGKDAPTEAGVDILGWDFAFELNETAKQVAAESHVHVAFKKIPHEVLDKKAVEQGDVKFFELGALDVRMKQKGRELTLILHDFVIPYDDIPKEVQGAIKHWSQLVDYWAVDWDYKNDTFHNQWQSYRTRKDPKIELEAKYAYPAPGKYSVVVKVIDILGNDTTKTLEVEVK